MASQQTFDITRFVDERRMNGFNAMIVIFCFFIILFDGYDIGTVGSAGPAIVKLWGLKSMAALGLAFSAALFGILFGSTIFGWIGDRYGRRVAIVLSLLTIGVFSLLTMTSDTLTSLAAYRFLTGIGLGGMPPNTIVLNAEFAPKRARATMIIVMFTGITFGGAVPGLIASSIVPAYGWQSLFFIGGVTPIVIAIAAWLWLPESLKHLVVKAENRDKVMRTIRAMDPSLEIGANTRFVVSDEKVYAQFRPKQLFEDGMHWITPLLWICFICNLMSFYFMNQFLPTVLAQAHVPMSDAYLSTSVFQIGGTLGGLALSRPIDKMGLMPVCFLFVVSLCVAPFTGYATAVSESFLMAVIFFCGFTLLGLQFGLNATSAMIYPTSIRSNGSGWAFAVGRCGAVAGPYVAGALIDMHLAIQQLYLALLVPLAIGMVASFILARLYYVRFAGMGLGRRDALDAAARG
jgi:MFS transporter, AAHS family, 4-hydroxybenzoate transporter